MDGLPHVLAAIGEFGECGERGDVALGGAAIHVAERDVDRQFGGECAGVVDADLDGFAVGLRVPGRGLVDGLRDVDVFSGRVAGAGDGEDGIIVEPVSRGEGEAGAVVDIAIGGASGEGQRREAAGRRRQRRREGRRQPRGRPG